MICNAILASQGVKTELKDFVIDWYKQMPTEKDVENKIKMFFGVK